MLDDRSIRVDFDWGFEEGRQWGRGRSGGQVMSCLLSFKISCKFKTLHMSIPNMSFCLSTQVRDEYRTDYDPDIL